MDKSRLETMGFDFEEFRDLAGNELQPQSRPALEHVWPVGHRRAREGHPIVHEHEWHLAGLDLAGAYTDEIFTVQPTQSPTGDALHEVQSAPDGHDKSTPIPIDTFAATLVITSLRFSAGGQ